jgi:putative transcriptional regulator
MPIMHHPPDDTVLRYANGTLPEAPAIVVATHLSFCPDCRVRMQTYEMLGGSMLETVPPASLSPDALSATLARLDGLNAPTGTAGTAMSSGRGREDLAGPGGRAGSADDAGTAGPSDIAPRGRAVAACGRNGARADTHVPLTAARRQPRERPDLPAGMDWPQVLTHYDIPAWRFVMPGVKWTALSLAGPEAGQLLVVRGAPGAKLPSHGHDGTEYTCVLTGSFSDSTGTYTVGDLIEATEDHDHQPLVGSEAECVCVIAIEGHLRLHGLARLLQPFLGL